MSCGVLSSGRRGAVVGVSSRSSEWDLYWLKDFLNQEFPDLNSEVRFLPITDTNQISWEREVQKCSAGILHHTKTWGHVNITDVDGALYNQELQYLNITLGRERILVVVDDVENDSEERRRNILETQPSLSRLSSQLILIPEYRKRETASAKREEFLSILPKAMKQSWDPSSSSISYSTPRAPSSQLHVSADRDKKKDKGYFSPSWKKWPSSKSSSNPPGSRVRIFSRVDESNYSWLIGGLKAGEGLESADIRGAPITNQYGDFSKEARNCDFAILYHSLKYGRLNISDITSALYDNELQDLSNQLGKRKVIVVADDLKIDDQKEKDRILQSQPSIARYAGDLFLFTERQKSPQNLREIFRIIQTATVKTPQNSRSSNTLKPAVPSRAPSSMPCGTADQTSKGWFSSMMNYTKSLYILQPKLSQYRVRIFSRSHESNYSWLIGGLKAGEGLRSADIRGAPISNQYADFSQEVTNCDFAILYHTLKSGRLIISDITDSLYDTELQDLSGLLGKQKVIVVADDLKEADDDVKSQILQIQPSIARYARDLFLFTERQKSPQKISEISRIIIQRDLQHLPIQAISTQPKETPDWKGLSNGCMVKISGPPFKSANDQDISPKPFTSISSVAADLHEEFEIIFPEPIISKSIDAMETEFLDHYRKELVEEKNIEMQKVTEPLIKKEPMISESIDAMESEFLDPYHKELVQEKKIEKEKVTEPLIKKVKEPIISESIDAMESEFLDPYRKELDQEKKIEMDKVTEPLTKKEPIISDSIDAKVKEFLDNYCRELVQEMKKEIEKVMAPLIKKVEELQETVENLKRERKSQREEEGKEDTMEITQDNTDIHSDIQNTDKGQRNKRKCSGNEELSDVQNQHHKISNQKERSGSTKWKNLADEDGDVKTQGSTADGAKEKKLPLNHSTSISATSSEEDGTEEPETKKLITEVKLMKI